MEHAYEVVAGGGEDDELLDDVPVDDDLPPATTPLDDLRAELAEEVGAEPLTLPVPARPRYSVRYSTDVDGELLSRWTKASKDRHAPNGVDELSLACRILANQAIGVLRDGDELLDEGKPLRFRSRAFLDILGVGSPTEAVRKLYGRDGHVQAAALEVLRSAGYDDDALATASAADPTPGR